MAVGTLKLCKDPSPLCECGTQKLCQGAPLVLGRGEMVEAVPSDACAVECPGLSCVARALVSWDVTAEWEVERPRL